MFKKIIKKIFSILGFQISKIPNKQTKFLGFQKIKIGNFEIELKGNSILPKILERWPNYSPPY